MKDFPFFSTENGVASLTLKEIPYTKTAYIKIQDSLEPKKLLQECVEFCTMAGAEKIFASGHPILDTYPFHTQIVKMSKLRDTFEDTDAALFPITDQTVKRWLDIYNRRMADVPNYSYMSQLAMKTTEGAYFIHRGENLLGIGMASGEKIQVVISVQQGAGEDVVLALNHALSGEVAELEVASTNEKAIHLYEKMGFIKCGVISTWYCVL